MGVLGGEEGTGCSGVAGALDMVHLFGRCKQKISTSAPPTANRSRGDLPKGKTKVSTRAICMGTDTEGAVLSALVLWVHAVGDGG